MKKSLLLLIILLSILSFSATKALIVYVSQFDDPQIDSLKYAEKDAKAFAQALSELNIVKSQNIKIIKNPTLAKLRTALFEFFSTALPTDQLYFYFAGHGYYDNRTKQTYLITKDTDPYNLSQSALSVEGELSKYIKQSKASFIFIAMDSCYSGRLGLNRPLRFVKYSEDSIKSLTKAKKIAMLLSSKPNEQSIEDPSVEHGVFTYYLIKGLKGMANKDGDEYIEFSELAGYVKENVQKATNDRQHPVAIGENDLSNVPVAVDILKIEEKAVRIIRTSNLPQYIKIAALKVSTQDPTQDIESEKKIRNYMRKLAYGYLTIDEFYDAVKDCAKTVASVIPEVKEKKEKENIEEYSILKVNIKSSEYTKDAWVEIQGKKYKAEGLLPIKIKPGRIKVKINGPFIIEREYSLYIEPFQTKELTITPSPAKGIIEIDSMPTNASIKVNGKKISTTPYLSRWTVGKYVIEIEKKGYLTEKKTVVIEKDKKTKVFFELKQKPQALTIEATNYAISGSGITFKIRAEFGNFTKEVKPTDPDLLINVQNCEIKGEKLLIKDKDCYVKATYRETEAEKDIKSIYTFLTIDSSPQNAVLTINGEKYTTPLTIPLKEKEIEITAEKNGYEKKTIKLTLQKGKSEYLIVLTPKYIKEMKEALKAENINKALSLAEELEPAISSDIKKAYENLNYSKLKSTNPQTPAVKLLKERLLEKMKERDKKLTEEIDKTFEKSPLKAVELLKNYESELTISRLTNALKAASETKIKIPCKTYSCEHLSREIEEYIKSIDQAIEEKNNQKLAKLLDRIYPGVSKALRSEEKPWSKALNVCSDEVKTNLCERFVENAKSEGAKIINKEYIIGWKVWDEKYDEKTYKWYKTNEKVYKPNQIWDENSFITIIPFPSVDFGIANVTSSASPEINGKYDFCNLGIGANGPISPYLDENGLYKGWFFGVSVRAVGLSEPENTSEASPLFIVGVPTLYFGYEILRYPYDGFWWYEQVYVKSDLVYSIIPYTLFFEAKIGTGFAFIEAFAKAGFGWFFSLESYEYYDTQDDEYHSYSFPSSPLSFMYYISFGIGIEFGGILSHDVEPIYEHRPYAEY